MRDGTDGRRLVKTRAGNQRQEQALHTCGGRPSMPSPYQSAGFEHLLIGAPTPDVLAELEQALHPYLRDRIAGRLSVPIGVGRERLDRLVHDAEGAMERRAEAALVSRLREAAGTTRGVTGLAGTLSAIGDRRSNGSSSRGYTAEAGAATGAGGWPPSGAAARRAPAPWTTSTTWWRTPSRRPWSSTAGSRSSSTTPTSTCSGASAPYCGIEVLRAGVDIGGTKCLGVVVDDAGAILREERLTTPAGADALLDVLDELAGALAPYDRFGVGAAGLVSIDGVWRAAPNVSGVWDFLDRRAAGRPARPPGPGRQRRHLRHLAERWQAGAALGRPMSSSSPSAPGSGRHRGRRPPRARGQRLRRRAGHMVVDPNGPPCVCGRRGCWERYASGSGLARLARRRGHRRPAWRAVALAGDAEAVRGEHVQFAAWEGDHEALVVIDQWAWWVALGLVNLTNLLDPEIVVMGGGLAGAVDLVLAPVRRHFADLLYAPAIAATPHRDGGSGEQAGAIGAAPSTERAPPVRAVLLDVPQLRGVDLRPGRRPRSRVVEVLPGSRILYMSKKFSISARGWARGRRGRRCSATAARTAGRTGSWRRARPRPAST